jgi:hypothetical protein
MKGALQRWADAHVPAYPLEKTESGVIEPVERGKLPMETLGEVSVHIGDAVYNLRAALDYLVFVLASFGEGQQVEGTQFPIEDSMDMFTARITGAHPKSGKPQRQYLKGVPSVAVHRIRQLQPCWNPPCEWTRTLRELSNPDKHQHLSSLTSRATWIKTGERLEGTTMHVRGHIEVEVRFLSPDAEAHPLLETLHREVRAVVDGFKPAFERLPEEDLI